VHVFGALHTWWLPHALEQTGVEHVAPLHPFGAQSHPPAELHRPAFEHCVAAGQLPRKNSNRPSTVVAAMPWPAMMKRTGTVMLAVMLCVDSVASAVSMDEYAT